MDDIMKEALILEAFSKCAMFGTYVEILDGIENEWEQLFRSLSKYKIYSSFRHLCGEINLPWKTYDTATFNLFLSDWKEEIKCRLIYRIKEFFLSKNTLQGKVYKEIEQYNLTCHYLDLDECHCHSYHCYDCHPQHFCDI